MSDTPKVNVRRFSRGRFAETKDAGEAMEALEMIPELTDIDDIADELMEREEEEEDDFFKDLKTPAVIERPAPPTPNNTPEPPPLQQQQEEPPDRPFTDHHLLCHVFPEKAPKKGRGGKKAAAIMPSSGGYDDLFGTPTPILGTDKRVLLTRIREYKALFNDIPEIKSFRIKPNATDAELEQAIAEMDTIVSCGTVQQMCDEMILSCIRVVEGVSSRTERMNLSGTADMLRANPDFHKLAKMLTIKYRVFSQIPAEYQMLMLVMSTAMVARQKNIRALEVGEMLNRDF
jgi:hypothetical protein